LHSQERVSRQCPYHSEFLYIHKHHQGGPTSSKAIFKNPPLHSQERVSRQCPYHSEFLYIHKHHQGGPTSSKAISCKASCVAQVKEGAFIESVRAACETCRHNSRSSSRYTTRDV